MANWGMFSFAEAPERILPLVDKALSLDNRMAEVWQHLADVRQTNGDLEGARAAEQRALELDPQDPAVLRSQILSWSWTHEPERGLSFADELLRRDPLSPSSINRVATLYERLGRFDDAQRILDRMYSIDPQDPVSLWRISHLARKVGDLATTLRLQQEVNRLDPRDPEVPPKIASIYLDLGDVSAAEYWETAALRLDSKSPQVKAMAALLHFVRDEEAEAVAIARELTAPNSFNRWGSRGIALRIVAAPELAAGDYEEIIARYLTHYPELADGKFPTTKLLIPDRPIWEAFLVTLDLASVYLHAGEKAKAESLLTLVESELPHWPRAGAWIWGYGIADVELHALRGEKEQALAALQEHAAAGTRDMWRWELLYNSNLDSIRETPEFAAFVAEMEADMAEQLARVREMERNGELEPIPEVSAAIQ
jgi:tetratricopeptide (TPR) repeat protein